MTTRRLGSRVKALEHSVGVHNRNLEELQAKLPGRMTETELIAVMLGHWPNPGETIHVRQYYRSLSAGELRSLQELLSLRLSLRSDKRGADRGSEHGGAESEAART